MEKVSLKRKILLLYPYYWPHYKAGGPVQSLFNLAAFFKEEADFYCISLAKDIDGSESLEKIKLNCWNKGLNQEHIYFSSRITFFLLHSIIEEIKPDVIFINGMFNLNTSLSGIVAAKLTGSKIIISPRGMLQAWGLKRNGLVKKVYLKFLKLILKRNELWHVTDVQESTDVLLNFGKDQQVHIASNIPRSLSSSFNDVYFPDIGESIKLVFLSLINPNKNIHLIIEEINRLENFTLDIYGPIIDKDYWQHCQNKILDKAQIVYRGAVPPWQVPDILKLYHFFVLPTQGENFGHAIFDSLSSGVPVIITRNTPWKNIDSLQAGLYIEENKVESLHAILIFISMMSAETYKMYRQNSILYAKDFLIKKRYHDEYSFLIES